MEMTKREENHVKIMWLNKYRAAVREEQMILDEIQRLREDKMFPSLIIDGMPHGSSQSDLSAYAARLDEQMAKLKEWQLEKVKMYEKFGFTDLGQANSTWGGEAWHAMSIEIGR